MFLFFMLYHFFAIWKFLKLGNLAGDFLGVNFRSRDLLGVLGIFWGFDLSPFDHPHHFKSGVPFLGTHLYRIFGSSPSVWVSASFEYTLAGLEKNPPVAFW